MNAIFMNPKNSKISDPYRLLFNLTDKDKYIALPNLSIYYN